MAIARPRSGMWKLSLKHLVLTENKKALNNNKKMGDTLDTEVASYGQIWDNLKTKTVKNSDEL